MVCANCNNPLDSVARFCPMCGTARVQPAAPTASTTASVPRVAVPLLRSRSRRMIGGVCAGFADHYGWDLNVVRLATVAIALFTFVGFLFYVAAWIIIPDGQYALSSPVPPPPLVPPAGTGQAGSMAS